MVSSGAITPKAFGQFQYPTSPLVEDEEQVIARVQEYLADAKERAALPPPSPATGYEASDLDVLFGGELA